MRDDKKIMILGAGPCGLGAAWRLAELGLTNYEVYETESYPGGLAASFVDEKGFTWDIGGHVGFSHYDYYDRVLDAVVPPDEWVYKVLGVANGGESRRFPASSEFPWERRIPRVEKVVGRLHPSGRAGLG